MLAVSISTELFYAYQTSDFSKKLDVFICLPLFHSISIICSVVTLDSVDMSWLAYLARFESW